MKNHKLMTLEEAILHCEGKKPCGDSACALELKQLAEWLTELQQYRNRWKDKTELPKENVPIIAYWSRYSGYFSLVEGVFEIIDKGSKEFNERYFIGDYCWDFVLKWAYKEEIFPYKDFGKFVISENTLRKDDNKHYNKHYNRALESHKAWEESLLYADRIRGYY